MSFNYRKSQMEKLKITNIDFGVNLQMRDSNDNHTNWLALRTDEFERITDILGGNRKKSNARQAVEILKAVYLEYRNEFLTIDKFAEHNGLSVEVAAGMTGLGKYYLENPLATDFPMDK